MPRDFTTIAAPTLLEQVETAAALIAAETNTRPRVGIILGTGLGRFIDEVQRDYSLRYDAVPNFPQSTAPGHSGRLTCGTAAGVPVLAMEGRFHVYEGYPAWQITLPVRVMHRLGVGTLIVSNAAGAVNPQYKVGDVMVIADHINLMGANPLIGETSGTLGTRFPELSAPYDGELLQQAEAVARRENFACHRGVYVALSGPNYETRAEYRMLRRIGGDAVGMSTVPEVLMARQLGMRVLALSTMTNVCLPDALGPTDGEDVVAAAAAAERKLRAIVLDVIRCVGTD